MQTEMKKLLSYLKPYWKAALLAPILMLIEVICDLSQPTLLASIVDNGVAKSNLPYILNTGVLMLGIANESPITCTKMFKIINTINEKQ